MGRAYGTVIYLCLFPGAELRGYVVGIGSRWTARKREQIGVVARVGVMVTAEVKIPTGVKISADAKISVDAKISGDVKIATDFKIPALSHRTRQGRGTQHEIERGIKEAPDFGPSSPAV